MHYKTVEKLKKDLKEFDTKLTKIENTINNNMKTLEIEGYEAETQYNEKWIIKNDIEQTEEIAKESENWSLLLTIRQCILWEMYNKEYQYTLRKLDKAENAI